MNWPSFIIGYYVGMAIGFAIPRIAHYLAKRIAANDDQA
jgi:uncharacterized membrane-anchored protein YhcB (DUF1043 family)